MKPQVVSNFDEIVKRAERSKDGKKMRLRAKKVAKTAKKQRSMKAIERELWELCRKLTFDKGTDCYTCPQKNLKGINLQCGHYFPKGALGASMKYDLRVLRAQCFNCNINYGGMGGVFRENMKKEVGEHKEQDLYNECSRSKGYPIKARDHYLVLIQMYKLYRFV